MLTELFITNPTTGQVEVPLSERAEWIEEIWTGGVAGTPALTGGPLHLPYRPGAIWTPQDVGAREISIGMAIASPDHATLVEAVRDLSRLVWSPRQPLTLTRQLPDGARQVAQAVLLPDGIQPAMQGPITRVVLGFSLVDGWWIDAEETVIPWPASGTTRIVVDSDDATQRVRVTYDGGSYPGISATSLASNAWPVFWTSYDGTPTPPVTVDVWNRTATQDGADVRQNVHGLGPRFWFELPPGPVQIDVSGGGTGTLAWKGVHL